MGGNRKAKPKSLQQAILYFSKPDNCINYLAAHRWPKGVACPTCGSAKVKCNAGRRIWQCSRHHVKRQFSVKVGTIFEDSTLPLDKWLAATWLLANCKNGISSYEIARDLKVTQKTAWFMTRRIRLALPDEVFGSKRGGEVKADETFIGGKARNIHVSERRRRITGTGGKDKTVVRGILEGKVRTAVIPNRRKTALQERVKKQVTADDASRFNLAVSQTIGRRLTFAQLTGKTQDGRRS